LENLEEGIVIDEYNLQISDYKNSLYNLQSRKSKAVSFVVEYNGDIDSAI
jgi:hypothetical protein